MKRITASGLYFSYHYVSMTAAHTLLEHTIIPFFSRLFSSGSTAPKSRDTIEALWRVEKIILDTLDFNQAVQNIVDSILVELGYLQLGYRIVVLALVDHSDNNLKRISISQTDEAKKALAVTPVPFKDITIPLTQTDNYCIKALLENKPYVTHDWIDILSPSYSADEARQVQAVVGIRTSMVYPVIYRGKPEGVMIFSLVKDESQVSDRERDLIKSFTDIVGLAVQNAKLYTTLQETTDKLKKANETLQELNKLKDEFVSLASHELRTPMTAIKGSLSTVLEGYAGEVPKEAKEFLTASYNENDRLIRLVNNLLNISRIESGRFSFAFEKVNIDELIAEVVSNLEIAAKEKHLFLRYERNNSIPQVMADSDKLKEVLINLIGNATKYTHEGGVLVKTEFSEGKVIVSITDTGHGISKEDQEILFQKFSRVQKEYSKQAGGTGLGLYICKKIIEGHKGEIWLQSEVGQGSIFFFSVPVAQ